MILALPAYNEAENIEPLLRQAAAEFGAAGYDWCALVVNDGSTDATAATTERLRAEGLPVELITHPENRGLGGAIKTCMREATARCPDAEADIIINMDADNTHDPKFALRMVDLIRAGSADIVIASRYRDGSQEVGVPLFRLLLSRGARLMFQLVLRLPDVRDYTCGYRAYRASVITRALEKYGDQIITRQGFACTDEVLVKLSTITRRITEVPFVLRYDKKRSPSKLPLFRTIWETLKMLASARH